MTTLLDQGALLPVTHGLEVGPWNTGIPAGTVLTPQGIPIVTANDLVYDAIDCTAIKITTGLRARFTRCRVKFSGALYGIDTTTSSATSLADAAVFEDCEIDGGTVLGASAIAGGRAILRRCNIYGGGDIVKFSGQFLMEDCWLHDFYRQAGGHHDGLQVTSGTNMTVRRCKIDMYREATDDNGNACLQVGNTQGGIDGLTIEDCHMDGGNYVLNSNNGNGNVVQNVQLRRNTFGPNRRFGIAAGFLYGADVLDASNVHLLTGIPVTV